MKKILLLLTLLITTFALRAEDEKTATITFSQQGYSDAADVSSFTVDNINFALGLGSNTNSNKPKYYNTGTGIRLYVNNTVTVTPPEGVTITKLEFKFSGSSYMFTTQAKASIGTLSHNNTSYVSTWTGSCNSTTSLVVTADKTVRWQTLTVTYTQGAVMQTVETPVFTPADGTTLEEGDLITIDCATADATIYYTTDGTDPDENATEYTDPIEFTGAMTVKAIAIKEGMKNSAVASATYRAKVVGANEVTFDFTSLDNFNKTYTGTDATTEPADMSTKAIKIADTPFVADDVTLSVTKPSGSDPLWGKSSSKLQIRVYTGNQLNVEVPQGYAITSISFAQHSGDESNWGVDINSVTDGSSDVSKYTWNSNNREFSASVDDKITKVSFKMTAKTFLSGINVTYAAIPAEPIDVGYALSGRGSVVLSTKVSDVDYKEGSSTKIVTAKPAGTILTEPGEAIKVPIGSTIHVFATPEGGMKENHIQTIIYGDTFGFTHQVVEGDKDLHFIDVDGDGVQETSYTSFVVPDTDGPIEVSVTFATGESEIESLVGDVNDGHAEVYDLRGIKVDAANIQRGNIYILRQGNTIQKVLVK